MMKIDNNTFSEILKNTCINAVKLRGVMTVLALISGFSYCMFDSFFIKEKSNHK